VTLKVISYLRRREGKLKNKIGLLLVVFVAIMLALPIMARAQQDNFELGEFEPFAVYVDRSSRENHYIASGWMGDYGDIRISEGEKENPYSGTTCIKITYTAEGNQGAGWAGLYWQWPPNNWGERKGGFDLTGATKLTFWARGENGGEQIMEFKMGGLTGTYSDSDSATIGPVELTLEWTQYTIDLSNLDLSYISAGFCWVTNNMAAPDGVIFYLDDIIYE